MVKDYNFGKFMSKIYSFIASIFAITLIILGIIIIMNTKTTKGEIIVETKNTKTSDTSPDSIDDKKIVTEIEQKDNTGIILIIIGILILIVAWLWVYFTHKNKDLQNVQGIGVEKDITF